MTVHHVVIVVHSPLHRPMFHDVTAEAVAAVAASGIRGGTITVYSQHTTCSVIIQEESHDRTFDGTEFLLQDMLDRLELMAPTCRHEGQYMHPGPRHIAHATGTLGEEAWWSLNTEAHIRSGFIGRSETIPVNDGAMELGEFGRIYFVDFDGTRPRDRKVHFTVMGE
ncbi:MAG TPA: secondary thiamine-phosphate synthase enzyme YjbQ [Candidatus Limnocylindrales bacterium]|jgi:secondary thiamine-phosphate synthase enzyme